MENTNMSLNQFGGVPLEKLQGIITACPPHLRARGQTALDKAQRAESAGDDRSTAEADRELAVVVSQAITLSQDQQLAKLVTASRRTMSKAGYTEWLAKRAGY
jgi:hypothetical protein